MGYGEVVGNQSVHWTVVHEDTAGLPKQLKVSARKQDHPEADRVRVSDDAHRRNAAGHDPIAIKNVGKTKGHPGKFIVTMRYRTMEEAQEAGTWVAENVRPGLGGFVLCVTVPAISRNDPSENPPAEVRIDW